MLVMVLASVGAMAQGPVEARKPYPPGASLHDILSWYHDQCSLIAQQEAPKGGGWCNTIMVTGRPELLTREQWLSLGMRAVRAMDSADVDVLTDALGVLGLCQEVAVADPAVGAVFSQEAFQVIAHRADHRNVQFRSNAVLALETLPGAREQLDVVLPVFA